MSKPLTATQLVYRVENEANSMERLSYPGTANLMRSVAKELDKHITENLRLKAQINANRRLWQMTDEELSFVEQRNIDLKELLADIRDMLLERENADLISGYWHDPWISRIDEALNA